MPEHGITTCDGEKEFVISKEEVCKMHLRIESVNNFPTAAGVASSSSGLACVAACLSKLYQANLEPKELTILARLGSGSASRSLFGGFVEWHRGFYHDQEERSEISRRSFASQVISENDWTLGCLILIVQ